MPGLFHPRPDRRTDIKNRFLTISEKEGINKVGDGLRVKGAGSAGNHQRMRRVAVTREQRNPAKVQHGQNVGIGQFVLEAEADNLEGR